MTIGKIARWVVNLCDWMMGYQAKMIADAIKIILLMIPTIYFFMWFTIVMS